MPLSKRERKKAWRNLLATKYELKDRGYELEVDEFVRRKLGEKQREASFNPWMAYLKAERKKDELNAAAPARRPDTVPTSYGRTRKATTPEPARAPHPNFKRAPWSAPHKAGGQAPTEDSPFLPLTTLGG